MFKGAIKVASHNPISNKDRKKLKKDLTKDFPSDVLDMIFIKSSEISATKLQGSAIILYSDEEFPLFVDSTGNGDFFPSLYTVDAYPDICRNIHINAGVESFVLKGANLMWPGVADVDKLPADLEADNVVVVRKADGVVIAVGALGADVSSVQAGKQEGVAVYVLHVEGDSLWNAGSKVHAAPKWDRRSAEEEEQAKLDKQQKKKERRGEDEEEEDVDFSQLLTKTGGGGAPQDMGKGKGKQVIPKELKTGKDQQGAAKPKGKDAKEKGGKGDKDDKKGKKDKDAKVDKDKGKKGDKKAGKKVQDSESESEEETKPTKETTPVADDEEDSEDWKNEKKGKPVKKEKKDVKDAPKGEENEDEGVTKEQMKEMDEKIMEAFLNSTKISLTAADLPIECGKLWTNFIIKCKGSEHDDLDMKLSSHKKIGKFLQNLQKEKILTYEEASKKNPVPKVTKIDFSHKKIDNWEPTVTAKQLEQRNSKDDEEKGQSKDSWRVQLEITKLYRPNDGVKRFIEE